MLKWVEFVIFLMIFCAIRGEDISEQGASREIHGMSEIDQEGWRALKAFQDDDAAWIPHERLQEQSEIHVQKRRRLRKRKRRPMATSVVDEELSSNQEVSTVRRVLPQRFEHNLESWKDMSEEVVKRPNIRRRVTPVFPSQEVNDEDNMSPLEAVVSIEEETPKKEEQLVMKFDKVVDELSKNGNKESEPQKATIPDLKAVLKQSGTGSLSEILQQKNLTLSELLMGNQKAISALTETPQEVTEADEVVATDTPKYKRLPPSVGLRKNINRNFEQEEDSFERLSNKEMLEAQRKRLSLLGHKDNRLFSTVTKYDVITEPTTERRIFVPSHPKYYSQTHVFRPDINLYNDQFNKPQETIKEISSTTTTTVTPKTMSTTTTTTLKPKSQDLPLTNAKIHKLTKKLAFKIEESEEEEEEEEEENYPIRFNFPEPVPIDIQEVTGYENRQNKFGTISETDNNDKPVKMSIDLDVFTEKITEKLNPETYSKTTPTSAESTTTEELRGVKVVQATAKDEIMEIMRDPISRERLSRILENRNMTVKELVEQRERGSSQLHLADIFHNKTREPEPNGEPFVGTINLEHFNSFPLFGRQQKSRTFGNEQSDDESSILHPSSTASVVQITEKTTEPTISSTSFPAVKIAVENTKDQIQPFLWKQLESDLFSRISQNNNQEAIDKLNDPLKEFPENDQEKYTEDELQRLDDIDAKFSLVSNEKLDVENSNFPEEEEVLINIPSGVKSAIFVSLAIVCLSIVVFLTILLVFKWTQRQNKRSITAIVYLQR